MYHKIGIAIINKVILRTSVCCFCLFAFLSNAQVPQTLDTNETKPFQHSYQEVVNAKYPFLVTSITTKNGQIYRGRLLASDSLDFGRIRLRNNDEVIFHNDSIEDLVWETGGRKDFSHYFGAGTSGLTFFRHQFHYASGYNFMLGWELPSGVFFELPFMMIMEWNNEQNQVANGGVFLEFMGGYRFNRQQSIVHSISGGGGIGQNNGNLKEGFRDPIILSAQYDVEFPLGKKSGASVFSRFQYFPSGNNYGRIILGVNLRFYKPRISEVVAKNKFEYGR
ncbi:MAG: hypothetical protein JJU02_12955 [Cryomorphaceae bacterium]|nr:hypothetical protein [Cryomorphaceae bacterium]